MNKTLFVAQDDSMTIALVQRSATCYIVTRCTDVERLRTLTHKTLLSATRAFISCVASELSLLDQDNAGAYDALVV